MLFLNTPEYSQKKRERILETRAERAVLQAYFDNQAILEPILYRASKCKQTNKAVKIVF